MVTEASATNFSQGKRDGEIRAQEMSMRLMSKAESKQDININYFLYIFKNPKNRQNVQFRSTNRCRLELFHPPKNIIFEFSIKKHII